MEEPTERDVGRRTVRARELVEPAVAPRAEPLRLCRGNEGALVDMRSAARSGAHDLGADAARIRAFFTDLDASLQGIGEEQGSSG